MSNFFLRSISILWVAISVGFLGGCSQSTDGTAASQVDAKAFDSADPALKADWEKIRTAADTLDYATAILTCKKLQAKTNLTPEQRTSVDVTMTEVNNKLTAAAEKGDAKALAAVQEIRKQWR